MALKFTNNASTTLSGAIGSSDTSIQVVDASDFPSLATGDYGYLTIVSSDNSKVEIVKATALSGNTFTVARAQDSTTAQSFDSGSTCELRITAALLTELQYTKPSAEPISYITNLQTSLDGKVDDSQVLTDVPSGAVFTDTTYTKPSSEPISYIDGLQPALDGKVDDSQVLTNVPSGAVFTDTAYTKPSSEPISYIDGLQTALDTPSGGAVVAVASGALENGDTVILNSDGTVSSTGATSPSISSTTGGILSSTGDRIFYPSAAYHSVEDKVVVAYRDFGNAHYGKIVAGSVSGGQITFGTPYIFYSSTVDSVSICYDPDSVSILMAFEHSGTLDMRLFTVSGTTISAPSYTGWGGANTIDTGAYSCRALIVYDTVNSKFIIGYKKTDYKVVVGTVLGAVPTSEAGVATIGTIGDVTTSINVSVSNRYGHLNYVGYGKFLVVVKTDNGGTYQPTAYVGTVSGTGFTVGVGTNVNSLNSTPATVYDSTSGKALVLTQDPSTANGGNNTLYPQYNVLTIGVSSVTVGTTTVLTSTAWNDSTNWRLCYFNGLIYISHTDPTYPHTHGVVHEHGEIQAVSISGTSVSLAGSYLDISLTSNGGGGSGVFLDTGSGIAHLYNTGSSYPDGGNNVIFIDPPANNLTATNYLGISSGTYADGASATIQSLSSVATNQSGLTIGEDYYVQSDGSLGLTPDPAYEVYTGIATSATDIAIRLTNPAAINASISSLQGTIDGISFDDATTSASGFMSGADKAKLDGMTFTTGSSFPAVGSSGSLFFNTSDGALYLSTGSQWSHVGPSSATFTHSGSTLTITS